MNITFFTPHIDISGGVKIILGYADRFTKRGHKVTVICPQPTLAIGKIKGIPIVYPKRAIMKFLKRKPGWVEVAADIKYVPSYNEKYIPDGHIVVATAWQTAPYVASYSVEKGKKFHLFMHYERLWSEGCNDVDRFSYRLPLKKIVVSSCLQQTLKEEFKEDSILIRTPVDLEVFYQTREGYNKNKRICMLRHPSAWKGVSEGIEALRLTKRQHPDTQLVMFGSHTKQINFECEYHYRPTNDELREIYNSCDIFLCPSWREGFGLPSAEAMACRCALVTTDHGGSRDYAIHGKTALVSPPKNPEALAENLNKLLGDEELLKRIAQNGYEYIRQFTWEKAVDKMEKLFLEELKRDT